MAQLRGLIPEGPRSRQFSPLVDSAPQKSQRPFSSLTQTNGGPGQGVQELPDRITEILSESQFPMGLLIPHDRYDDVNQLHKVGAIRQPHPLLSRCKSGPGIRAVNKRSITGNRQGMVPPGASEKMVVGESSGKPRRRRW